MSKSSTSTFSFWRIFIGAWIIFSGIYIGMDLWRDGLKLSNQMGYERAYVEVIQRSGVCEPFKVFAGGVEVDLVNMKCLQPPEGAEGSEASEEAESTN